MVSNDEKPNEEKPKEHRINLDRTQVGIPIIINQSNKQFGLDGI